MRLEQIDNEVSGFLRALEQMEDYGIINKMERSIMRTKVKAWAYDRNKEAIASESNPADKQHASES
jgi:hypothetical protein